MYKRVFPIGIAAAGVLVSTPVLAASICIDPGHGGSDPGACACGLEEADINLSVSLKLKPLLEKHGITVFMTRTGNTDVGLSARAAYANSKGVDRFASIHSNAGGGTGTETFCMQGSTSSSTGWKLAAAIQSEMISAWGLTNRGVKTANYAVLRETDMAASLTELAFIDMCSPDAEYLASDARRNEAACAHLKGIASHFGISASCSTAPPVTTGKAMGAIFEDKGSGTADMTTRLAGATATVKESGASMTVSGAEAFYSFTLNAGSYTIQASMAGYDSNTAPCAVKANETTWCSIGLKKSAVKPPEDAGTADTSPPGEEDAGQADAADDTSTTEEDAEPDGSTADAGASDGKVADAPKDAVSEFAGYPAHEGSAIKGDDGCGCRTVPTSAPYAQGAWALLGVALLGLRRRRRSMRAGALAAASLALLGCSSEPEPSNRAVSTQSQAQVTSVAAAKPTTAFARLSTARKVLTADYAYPVLSPDARWLAVTRPGMQGLWIASTVDGKVVEVSQQARSGYLPMWRSDSAAVGYRDAAHQPSDAPTNFADLSAHKASSFISPSDITARQTEDDRVVLRAHGKEATIDDGKDKYFAPVVAKDGSWVAYTGISTGIYLYQVSQGKTVHLGAGTHPSLSADGQWLAFERTSDDGEVITGGDLYLCNLADSAHPVMNLTETAGVIERTPSLSSDGRQVAYATAEGVFVAAIVR